ncbi:ABC transporter permease subunit [Spiractinospora alimapuensis]|uniref:ABC transporter permease n=1 Tax=Spiractinospora alimapuensis TaxID=2820884 RepID=UPI001F436E25|nr:ABC transporter permease subunit [Spiractinospora alimapuensis]QVQ51211.1 ABC transporter permease subunit [Spiractinospora alimapuensis]
MASSGSTPVYLPPLQVITESLVNEWIIDRFVSDLLPSVGKFLAGFAIASILGVGGGIVLGMNRTARALLAPLVLFLRSVPGPVLVPFGILFIGIGAPMNIFIIVLGAVWPTLLSTTDGVRGLDSQLEDVTRSYRLTFFQQLVFVVLPSASPQIFAGLRTSLQLSIILIVVAEMVGSTNGIGYYILLSQQTFEVADTWAGTLLLGALGYLASLLFLRVERRALAWQHGMHAATGKE